MRVVALFLVAAAGLPATIIGVGGNGNTLASGTVEAVWADATSQIFPILGSGSTGQINQAGAFNFSVSGVTQGNPWTLTNNRASNLVSFIINLSTAQTAGVTAVFDDGRIPFGDPNRAPGSGTGVAGGVTSATTFVFNFDLPYTADGGTNMFLALNVTSITPTGQTVGSGLLPGTTFTFSTDTDLIAPEPATWMMALGFCAAGMIRRNRRA